MYVCCVCVPAASYGVAQAKFVARDHRDTDLLLFHHRFFRFRTSSHSEVEKTTLDKLEKLLCTFCRFV